MHAQRNGVPMLAASGFVALRNGKQCEGCGDCAEACQFDAIDITNGKAVLIQEKCMGCGVCVAKCPNGALTLERDASKGEPLEIHALMERALSA